MRKKSVGKLLILLSLVWLIIGSVPVQDGSVYAQDDVQLYLGQPDISAFPQVAVPLRAIDAQGAPVSDLSRLSLRENGIPLEYELTTVPLGLDITFVIDANTTIETDDSGNTITRREKVIESISQFAGQYMDANGQDRISVMVPDEGGEHGRFFIQDNLNPVPFAQAITAYKPKILNDTPLNEMLSLAIQRAAQAEDGRFPAVMLYTDGGQLAQQLDYAALVEQAQAAGIPIYAAILGAEADANEIDNISRLVAPTGGAYVHMPNADDADPIFQVWQTEANQTRIVYQSLQIENGRYPITINLGSAHAATELVLDLAAPEVSIQLPQTEFVRSGDAFDTPLAELEPTTIEVPVLIGWPDGVERPLTAVALLTGGPDGQTNTIVEAQPDEEGWIRLAWDVQSLREGGYELAVKVADSLGYEADSTPVQVILRLERPQPPTPTPQPTPTPGTAVPQPVPIVSTRRLVGALGLSLLAGLVAVVLLWRRWRRSEGVKGSRGEDVAGADNLPPANSPLANLQTRLLAALEDEQTAVLLPLVGDNVTIGRDEAAAQLVLDDKSVGRLHARIRWRDGRYWLYDEGSSGGTMLNFDRLGLAPRPLQDGDQIQMGRLRFYFRLGVEFEEEE
ncbi:MAG: FHA domain-containing protein [Ardenticatenaceae bacterium]|nr:FHA domain-containing protein [Ardenticatenaceae bacterium]MCB9444635.1 FHA domain-containing protein [Ardenticatenaceae bacterium]